MTIIIVDYNSIDATIEYIDRCRQSLCTKEKLSFVIVENGDVGNSAKLEALLGKKSTVHMTKTGMVLKYFYGDVEIYYFFANNNLGFAKGNNRGIAITEELIGDEYYIISNNDISFPKKVDLDLLVRIMKKNKKMAVLGPRVVGVDGIDQSPSRKLSVFELMFNQYWRFMTHRIFKKSISDVDYIPENRYVYCVLGCFMLVKAIDLKNANYFDEGTFLFSEEVILAERLKKIDKYMYFYNDIQITHEGSAIISRNNAFIKKVEINHNSIVYYCCKYRNVGVVTKILSDLNFKIFKNLFIAKEKIVCKIKEKKGN